MRTSLPFLAVVPLFLFAYACDDGDGGGASGAFDAGPSGSFDAGPAPTNDAAAPPPVVPDAGTPDATVATGVLLRARRDGQPAAGVKVVFHDAAGAVVGEAQTDANGRVTRATAPSMVTVVGDALEGSTRLLTYLDVADGDVLDIELAEGEVGSTSSFTTTLSGTVPNAASYQVIANGFCAASDVSAAQPLVIDLFPSCTKAANTVLGAAMDVSDVPLKFAFKKGEAAPAAGQTRAVTLPAWADPSTTLVTATNLPAGVARERFLVVADGDAYNIGSGSGSLTGGGVTYRYAAGFADALNVAVSVADKVSSRTVARRGVPSASSAVDFSTALPKLSSVTATAGARPDVAWTSEGSLAAVDGGLVVLSWVKLANGEELIGSSWTFVVPGNKASFKAPELPAGLAGSAPTGAVGADAAFVETDLVSSAAQFKAIRIPLDGPPQLLSERALLPANGSLRITSSNRILLPQ